MRTRLFEFENIFAVLKSRSAPLVSLAMVFCLTGVFSSVNAQEPKYEMGTFYVCLLVKPANFNHRNLRPEITQKHFKHVEGLITSGKAAIAGPFFDESQIAGVIVLNASSPEEARALEEADPLVKEAGFSVEVLKWWAAKGIMKPPAQPFKLATYYFTFLRRGPKWTAEKTPETEKLQAAHMANINAMAKTGKLVIAGPFEKAGEYAGVFVFKVASLEEARALAESDPAVTAGRLTVDVHPWRVGEGSLP